MNDLHLLYRFEPQFTERFLVMKEILRMEDVASEMARLSAANPQSEYGVVAVKPPTDSGARKRVQRGKNVWEVAFVVFYLSKGREIPRTVETLQDSLVVHEIFNTEPTALEAVKALKAVGHAAILQNARFYPAGRFCDAHPSNRL